MPRPTYNWTAIRDEYVTATDEVSLRDLARKHGCHQSTIRGRSAREDWPGKRRQHRDRVSTEVQSTAIELEASHRAEMIRIAQRMQLAGMTSLDRHLALLEADPDWTLDVDQTRLLLKDATEIVRRALGIPETVDVREYERLSDDERRRRIAALLDRAGARRAGPAADGAS